MSALAKRCRYTDATRTLIAHSLDVALAANQLMMSPVMRRRLETACGHPLTDTHVSRLTILAGLHDCGKALVGFQLRITKQPNGTSHLAEVLSALKACRRVCQALRVPEIAAWFSDPSAALFASVCHHGGPVEQAKITAELVNVPWQVAAGNDYDPLNEIANLAAEMARRFPAALDAATPIDWTPSLDHLVAGLVMLADWIGSSCPVVGADWRPGTVRQVLDGLPWSCEHSGAEASSILPGSPIGAQKAITQVPTSDQLIIVEAPTGSGKTETALMRSLDLVSAGEVDGMFFALPTRSAATEIHQRIAAMAVKHSPSLKGKVVRAVPGHLDTDPWQGERSWAVASPKKVMAAPIVVGTIDQVMLTVLKNRHAWLRHAGLSRHLLVVDEVHASDPYMTEVIRSLVMRHLDLGGHCLLMSATLGESLRAEMEKRRPAPHRQAVMVPYPCVSSESGTTAIAVRPVASSVNLTDYAAAMSQVRACVEPGGCALVIRSTVNTAVATYDEMVAAGVPAMLHHSRYADIDRKALDTQLLNVIGKNGARRPMVIVATQTAEQSLDIDADLLVSDPAPADVLLQRRGRLGRHRPTQVLPMLVIEPTDPNAIVAAATRIAQGKQARMPIGGEWAYVYDPIATLIAMDVLRGMSRVTIPDDVRTLVETATHPDTLRAFAEQHEWMSLWRHTWGAEAAMRQVAQGVLIDWSRPYAEHPVEDRVLTRPGSPPVTISLSEPIPAALAAGTITAMPIPARWLRNVALTCTTIAAVQQAGSEWQLKINGERFIYGSRGLHRAHASANTHGGSPLSFVKHQG